MNSCLTAIRHLRARVQVLNNNDRYSVGQFVRKAHGTVDESAGLDIRTDKISCKA